MIIKTNNIRCILFVILTSVLTAPLNASIPPPERFEKALIRFTEECLPQYEALINDLNAKLKINDKYFRSLIQNYDNIIKSDLPGIKYSLDNARTAPLSYKLFILVGHMLEFRRTLDQIIIVNLSSNRLKIDSTLLEKLKKYWKDEEYFSWRFGKEIAFLKKIEFVEG